MRAHTSFRDRKVFLVVLITTLIISFFASTVTSNAWGNVCSDIKGSCSGAKEFYVMTDQGWFNNQYITLTQTKGRMKFGRATFTSEKYKSKNIYATYYVTVTDLSSGRTVMSNKEWSSGSMKIKLGKCRKYSVKVAPKTTAYYGGFGMWGYSSIKWEKKATWKVKRTGHCSFCEW